MSPWCTGVCGRQNGHEGDPEPHVGPTLSPTWNVCFPDQCFWEHRSWTKKEIRPRVTCPSHSGNRLRALGHAGTRPAPFSAGNRMLGGGVVILGGEPVAFVSWELLVTVKASVLQTRAEPGFELGSPDC